VERDAGGVPTAIVAPGGQRTALTLDADGFLATVADPVGGMTQLQHTPGGLLTQLTDAKGHPHTFAYDAAGRLAQDQDGVGGVMTLSESEAPGSRTVSLATTLGRTSTFTTEILSSGKTRYTNVDASGGVTTADAGATDETETVTYPDGRTVTIQRRGDPRFGFSAQDLSTMVYSTPGGRTMNVSSARSATFTDPSNLGTLVSLNATFTRNGNASTATYTSATRTIARTSAGGRQRTTLLDPSGRVASVTLAPGIDPVVVGRDAKGRISTLTQGSQSSLYQYDAEGRLVSRTDAAGATIHWGHDAAGRVTNLTTADNRVYGFAYDANGQPSAVTMPSGAVHQLTHTPIHLPQNYTPPGSAPYTRTYDVDTAFTQLGLPGGRTIVHAYDAGGRPQSVTTAEATVTYAYGDVTDRVTGITRTPPGGGTAEQLTFSYDGDLVTRTEFTGSAAGRFDVTHDDGLLPVSVALASGVDSVTTALGWDVDRLLATVGPFTITRAGPGGEPSRIDDGTFRLDFAYDSLGRVHSRTLSVGGTERYTLVLEHDVAGRISQRTETIGGVTQTFTYTYDLDGQLLQVDTDGVPSERHTYDLNGNRASRRLGAAAAVDATYDAQDRVLSIGATSYTIDADGMLAARGSATFTYGARRELIAATLPGQALAYAHDGLERRIARTDTSGTAQYLYDGVMDVYRLSASRDAAGTLSVYYYDPAGYLLAMGRGATLFYVATDQVGTPRAVFDTSGITVKRITYDAFGAVLGDTDPSFDLAIGFAGGLRDPATGLVRFGARDYDPDAGRWTARDPALYRGRQANLYAYVDNDPVDRRDPSGLWCIGVGAYVGLGAGGQYCSTDKGWSLCAEAGFGIGESLEYTTTPEAGAFQDPNAKGFGLADDILDTTGELKGGCGPVQAGIGFSIDRCGKGNCSGYLSLLQINCGTGDANLNYGALPSCGLSAKLAARSCLKVLD